MKNELSGQGLSIDSETVVMYGKISRIIPRASGLIKALEAYQKAETLLITPSKITGSEVVDILARQGISPHPATISRWFKYLGGFRKNRSYLPEKLVPVLAKAFIYQATNSQKLGA
ncbi:MAG: hypothetical protein F6K58_22490 [Symploca sp. SIO2E9]|nr:hypothetical protein [Symploca sp. SIO2E9]